MQTNKASALWRKGYTTSWSKTEELLRSWLKYPYHTDSAGIKTYHTCYQVRLIKSVKEELFSKAFGWGL